MLARWRTRTSVGFQEQEPNDEIMESLFDNLGSIHFCVLMAVC